jgi:hypothetical protein
MNTNASFTPHTARRPRSWRADARGKTAGALRMTLLATALSSCVGRSQVRAGATLEDGIVTLEQRGIEVTAQARPGLQHLPASVTPIRIEVTNRSDRGIFLERDDIELATTEDWVELATIPAPELPPPLELGLGTHPLSPYASIQGSRGGAFVYPSESQAYISGGWQDNTASNWLASTAFTSGFIDVGQSRAGYLYYWTPAEGLDRFHLRVRVRTGAGSGAAETLEIPYGTPG